MPDPIAAEGAASERARIQAILSSPEADGRGKLARHLAFNTSQLAADAMWGYRGIYKGQNWEWAGKWAAWADDVLSWMPARITALLLLVTGVAAHPHPNPLPEGEGTNSQPASLQPSPEFLPRPPGEGWGEADLMHLPGSSLPLPVGEGWGEGLRILRREARRTPSPNSGWPMAAMALVLGVRLHKPGVYVLNGAGRAAQAQDTQQAVVTASKALIILLCLVLATFSMNVWQAI